MKKASFIFLTILLASVTNFSYGRNENHRLPDGTPEIITTLIINADVRVVLVNNDKAKPTMAGNDNMTKFVTVKKQGDTLLIASTKNRNFKEAGVIYIPASQLCEIQINSKAHVSSLYVLHVPTLNIVVNAECQFSISNIGEVSLRGTESYTFEHTTEVRRHPASILLTKE